jgi:hypothetical protein
MDGDGFNAIPKNSLKYNKFFLPERICL